MADGTDVSENVSENGEETAENAGVMKCCGKRNSVYVCVNCLGITHKSCAKRMSSNLKVNDDGVTAICCDRPSEAIRRDEEVKKMSMEIEYLKRLVAEMMDKNDILKLSNGLLMEKTRRLEGEMSAKNYEHKKTEKLNSKQSYRNAVTNANAGAGTTEHTSRGGTSQLQLPVGAMVLSGNVGPTANVLQRERDERSVSRREVTSYERQLSTSALTENTTGNQTIRAAPRSDKQTIDSDSDFVEIRRRQRRGKRFGTGETIEGNNGSFAGEDRRAWIYLYRVKRGATEDVIREYIRSKPGFEKDMVSVREIPTTEAQLKCFVAIVPLDKRKEVYDPAFWPRNVGVKRFDFNRHRDFLAQAGSFFVRKNIGVDM